MSPGSAHTKGLSWVKDTATETIAVLRSLAELVGRTADMHVSVVVTTRPGYVVYEDDHQVVAEPFSETPTR